MEDLFPLNTCFAFNIQIRKFLELEKLLMAIKYIIRLMIVIILILFVQAKDLMFPFHHFSFSIHFPHPSQIDYYPFIYKCLDKILPNYKTNFEHGSTHFHECIVKNFIRCLAKDGKYVIGDGFKIYESGKQCLNLCFKRSEGDYSLQYFH